MRHTGIFLGLILSLAVGSAACSRGAEERGEVQDAREGAQGEEVTITGCLTGAPDSGAFVVTADRNALTSGALYSGDGETPTYTYELTGNSSDLAQHVGRQVQVTGHLEKRDDEVKVNEEEEAKLPETQSGDEKVTPAIETDTEMNINVRRLAVSTVTPTGQACNANPLGNH